jgi:hypothetical protein
LASPKKTDASNIFIVGTQVAECPICKKTKTLLLLRFGLNLCSDCLHVCMDILEQLECGVAKVEASPGVIAKTSVKVKQKK